MEEQNPGEDKRSNLKSEVKRTIKGSDNPEEQGCVDPDSESAMGPREKDKTAPVVKKEPRQTG
jgi:hypothetical protein